MNEKYEDIEHSLKLWLSGVKRVVVLGVGNPLRRDDFIGVDVVRGLRKKVSEKVRLIECETVPESFIEPITEFKPTHVLIVDAALLNLPPGSIRLVEPDEIKGIAVSTHALPLRILCDYIMEETGAKVALLAIQPEETVFGEGLTEKLKSTSENLKALLVNLLSSI